MPPSVFDSVKCEVINYYIDFSSQFSDPRSALCLVWEPIYEKSNKTRLYDLSSLDVFLETQSNIATVGGGWRWRVWGQLWSCTSPGFLLLHAVSSLSKYYQGHTVTWPRPGVNIWPRNIALGFWKQMGWPQIMTLERKISLLSAKQTYKP